MPDIPGLILSTMLNGGVIQYPNVQTYKAATLLRPEERPKVPVRVVEPTDYYQSESAKKGNVNAFVTPAHDTVYVSKRSTMLNDTPSLAAAIAHEQEHISNGPMEGPAYGLQYEVLKRIANDRKHQDQIDQLHTMSQLLGDAENRAAQRAAKAVKSPVRQKENQ